MATLSPIPPVQDSQASRPEAGVPDWKMGILEKKRRMKEVELLLKEEEVLKLKHTPVWKRDLIKRTRSSQKVPVFKMAAPPPPPSPPPRASPSSAQQQEYPPLPPWIREKLSQVANQPKQEQKPEQNTPPNTPEHSMFHVVQDIVHKFSSIPPPLPSPSDLSAQNFSQLTDSGSEHNLIDDPILATLPDWKRNIIVRRRRGQVLKRLSLTRDDLDMISTLQRNTSKSTPDSVDIQLQNISAKRDAKILFATAEDLMHSSINRVPDISQTQLEKPADIRVLTDIPKKLFVTQEPQLKVKDLRDKFAPIPQLVPSVALSPSMPKSIKIAKREFTRPPPPIPQRKQAITPPVPARSDTPAPAPPPLSPEQILTVEEYRKHHALLVKAIASQITPSMVNGNEGMFNFIIPEALPSKRPRTLSPDTPISSVDSYKQVTEISLPLYSPPVPKRDHSPSEPDSQTAELPLEEVTLSYIDEVSDDTVVPIHRPKSEQESSVPWKDTLDMIKTKRKERETADIYENIIVLSSEDVPVRKSSIKSAGSRSKGGRVYFSEKNPSVYQYPKMEILEEDFGLSNMNSFISNQEDLSHRIHPSIYSPRGPHQSDKLQNYTPAILDYFDSIATSPAQSSWLQGEGTEEQSPSREESDDIIDSFTAVPVDYEDELDMSNLSDRAAAMIW